jgi:methylated-DNA-[protein]-cysteine S-methyltransferase
MNSFSFYAIEHGGKISEIVLNKKEKTRKENSLERQCRKQIQEYLDGKRKAFSVPIGIEGTDFQKKVWNEMIKIQYGKTISYGELAKRINKPRAYRAVANACGANKLPPIIPCHRVVSSNGLGGYSAGIEIKKKLLEIESTKV